MIKFFKYIRKDLMEKNKTGKYLKYAIGEILLVVIGILIAVQINSWNQQRNRIELETVLLEQLRDETITVYGDITGDNNALNMAQDSHYRILDYISQNASYADSMCFDFSLIKIDEYIYPKDAVYGRIKDEGLDIITNDTIRWFTQSLYESIFPRLSRNNSFHPDISEYLNDYYLENFKPNSDYTLQYTYIKQSDTIGGYIYPGYEQKYPFEYTRNGINRKETMGYVPLDFDKLKNDPKFLMLLNQILEFRDYKIRRYKIAKNGIKELVEMIDKELENK